jgi:hypothetical protein
MAPTKNILLTLALFAALAAVDPAGAQTITPSNTAVSMAGDGVTLTHAGTTTICDASAAAGKTKSSSTNMDLSLSFFGNCVLESLTATVSCAGTVNIDASGAMFTLFDLNFNSGFSCTIAVSGVCNITFPGPQTTGFVGALDEAATTLTFSPTTLTSTRTGSVVCGPTTSTTSFISTSFNVTPTTLTFT